MATKRHPSIIETAQTGDHRATLEAMRDKLARDMDDAPPAVVAQIAGRLQALLTEIAGLGDAKAVSTLDELEKRRADRLAKANAPESSRRQTRQRRG